MHNLKLSFRNLKKNKLYSFLNIFGFAIGFAVSIIISLFVYQELTVDHCFPNHARIYRLLDAEKQKCDLDYNINQVLSEQYPEVETSCPLEYHTGRELPVIAGKNSCFVETIASTTNDFFKIFSIQVDKNGDAPFTVKNSVVITESLANTLFPNEPPLEKTINIAGVLDGTVTAVIKKFPENSSLKSDMFLFAENEDFRLAKHCDHGNCYTPTNHYILLRQGVDIPAFPEKLNNTHKKFQNRVEKVELQKLTDIYFTKGIEGSENKTGNKALVGIFVFIGLLIIILSCINYFNFSVSLQHKRLKETGIKKINGAGCSNLALYYLTEISLGIGAAVLLSLLFARLFLPQASSLFQKELDFANLFDPLILTIFISIIIVVIVINVLATLYVLLKFDIRSFLSGTTSSRGKRISFGILTVFQFAASIVLVVVVLTIQKQVGFVKHADLGFEKEHFVRLNLPFKYAETTAFKQEVEKLSFIKKASLSAGTPGRINSYDGSGNGENSFYLKSILVDNDFSDVFGLKLTEGRELMPSDVGKSCLMNEAAVKRYGWESIENKKFNNRGGLQVVGVVKDFHIASFHSNIEPVVLVPYDEKYLNSLSIRLTPGNVIQQIESLKKVWDTFIPDNPLDYTFYDSYFNSLYKKEERLAKAIGILSVIALIITGMGLLGQIFQICVQRTKEIGVRKVNGAKVSEILTMLNKDFVKWVVIAFVIATPVAYYAMNKWLENFAYKTTLSWWIFALAGVLALGIALLTVSWQSWRAATRNPVEALRYE